ncbi:unnamed protein product [Didymodactylos carnosus]|uniref:Uncharacterized protein n=1 Tax=Didymodactylos carnosus TaxID=1234261 RepID=A0A813NLH8_9BILA|nr:unnamed protein product [Didymodactylos carnosus]CAF3518772.1 unnamed protein product [Didymodactylos carnosus]
MLPTNENTTEKNQTLVRSREYYEHLLILSQVKYSISTSTITYPTGVLIISILFIVFALIYLKRHGEKAQRELGEEKRDHIGILKRLAEDFKQQENKRCRSNNEKFDENQPYLCHFHSHRQQSVTNVKDKQGLPTSINQQPNLNINSSTGPNTQNLFQTTIGDIRKRLGLMEQHSSTKSIQEEEATEYSIVTDSVTTTKS